MNDIIYRQAAIDALGERPMVWAESDYELGARNQYDADVLAFETVPPAQPDLSAYSDKLWRAAYERGKREAESERKRGEWIYGQEICREYMGTVPVKVQYSHWECSVCGYRTEKEPLWNYCPNCGAEMRGGDEDDMGRVSEQWCFR